MGRCSDGKNHKWGQPFWQSIGQYKKCEKCGTTVSLLTSRSDRASGVAYGLNSIVDKLNDIVSETEEKESEKETEELPKEPPVTQPLETLTTITVPKEFIDILSDAQSEVESLRDEMDDWASNMEGTSLENTEKYQTVSEARDTLDDLSSRLSDVSLEEEFEDVSELEDIISELEDISSELESVEFPSMYG